MQHGYARENFFPSSFVKTELVAHKRDEFTFFLWLGSLLIVPIKYLCITCSFYLFIESCACQKCSFLDEKVGEHIICFAINRIEIIAMSSAYMHHFFIKMDSSFDFWLNFHVKRILKKDCTFSSTG